MATLEEIFQNEINLEEGFSGLLSETGATVYHSRETDTAISPRIEIKVVVGKVCNHVHVFPDNQREVFDAWEGSLETEIITNRQTEERSKAHAILLGAVRAKLQQFYIDSQWLKYQEIALVDDIREQGTVDSFTDANDLDHSKITWFIVFNINPKAWPEGI